MELKQSGNVSLAAKAAGINRTSVELKRVGGCAVVAGIGGINRTSVELKPT